MRVSSQSEADEDIPLPYTDYTAEEIESRGEAIFVEQIRDRVKPVHRGQFLVIDIETGEYEIDADDLVATRQLLANCPNAVIYGLRIGFPTAYRIGATYDLPNATVPAYSQRQLTREYT